MAKLPIRTWIRNAAAVFSGQHGAVTRQAEQAGCSRETVYQHARKLERRLATEPATDAVAELAAENQRLRRAVAELERAADPVSPWPSAARTRRGGRRPSPKAATTRGLSRFGRGGCPAR